MGSWKTGLSEAVTFEYENYTGLGSYKTSPLHFMQMCLFGRQCCNAARLSQGTGMRSWGWGAYVDQILAPGRMNTTEDPRIHGESFFPCHNVGNLLNPFFSGKWQEVCHQGTFGVLLAGQLGRSTGLSQSYSQLLRDRRVTWTNHKQPTQWWHSDDKKDPRRRQTVGTWH